MEFSMLQVIAIVHIALCFLAQGALSRPSNDSTTLVERTMSPCQIVRHNGYECEIHHVATKDGYILELHRIPHGIKSKKATKGVAFLQHGLIDSSFTWIANHPNQSLGYMLADDGYDVWLGNSRGNTYSRGHKRLSTDDVEYWDFSFDHMAKYDNPASIDYVLALTGEKQVNYIGHSQGTMIGFAGFSAYPALARKIKCFMALAPVTHVAHMKGLIKIMSYGTWVGKKILGLLGTKNFMPNSWVVKTASAILCKGITSAFCEGIIFLITGFNIKNLIAERVPLYLAHTPAGTSVKDILHFSQLLEQDKFQMYDYGWNGNMHKYLQPYPPQYEVARMNVPTALFVGGSDWLATEQDISRNLRGKLPNIIYDQDIDDWNHMDFVWGKDANSVVYDNVVKLLNGKQPLNNRKRS